MHTTSNGAREGSDRFDHVERLIAQYPAVTAAEIEDLKSWFTREASALDVASLASNERVYPRYAAFRADHIDGFKARDYLAAALAVLLAAAAIFYLAM